MSNSAPSVKPRSFLHAGPTSSVGVLPQPRPLVAAYSIARAVNVAPEWLSHGTGQAFTSNDGIKPAKALRPADWKAPTPQALTDLGQRARVRRANLQLTRSELADQMGISPHLLLRWERKLPRRSKHDLEVVWEQLLSVPEGWLRNSSVVAPAVLASSLPQTIETKGAINISSEIRITGTWLCRASASRRTIAYHELSPVEQRRADIFSIRYGVDGEASSTLQAIGDRYGLTKERIRQIVQKMVNRSTELRLKTTHIDRLHAAVGPILPAPVGVIDTEVRDILGESLSIVSADRFCREILGRKVAALTNKPTDMTLSPGQRHQRLTPPQADLAS